MPNPEPVDELIEALDDASRLLRDVGEDRWAAKLENGRQLIAAGDAYGLQKVAALFGGTGSFTDLTIHPINGHDVEAAEVDEVNGHLNGLRRKIYARSRELIRELDLG